MRNNLIVKVKEYNKDIFNNLNKEKKYSAEINYFLSQRPNLLNCLNQKEEVIFEKEMVDAKIMAEKLDFILKNSPEDTILYTDYDNDGFSGGFIFLNFVYRKYGKRIDFHINDRITEGYGVNKNVIKDIVEKGYKNIITVDLGISNIDEIEYARNAGVNVFLTDHHLPKIDDNGNEILPNATIIVNANIEKNNNYERGVCGAYTIWHVLSFIDKEIAEEFVDLVALAMISDNMPLNTPIANNIVKKGLKKINNKEYSSKFVGNMIEQHKINKKINKITEMDLGFYVIPLINAIGRLGKVSELMKWAVEEDIEKYATMCEVNEKRKDMTKEFTEKAEREAQKLVEENEEILLITLKECPEGIVGLIASRICEKYKKPTIVATLDESGERYKASGRSKGNYNFKFFFADPEIKYIVSQVSEFDDEDEEDRKIKKLKKKLIKTEEENKLVQGGGHKFACGMSFQKKHLNILKQRLKEIEQPEEFVYEIDAIISLEKEIKKIQTNYKKATDQLIDTEEAKIIAVRNFKKRYNIEFVEDINKILYPFGNENTEPIFLILNHPENIKLLGQDSKHLKFTSNNIDCIAFNVDKDVVENYEEFYPIGNFSINEFNGKKNIQFMVKEFIHKNKLTIIN